MSKEKKSSKGQLVCVRECEIPEVGAFKVGDTVDNPDHAKLLADHPHFKKSERED
jgi:hypothetical protein